MKMNKMNKYIYTCHSNIVSSNHNKNTKNVPPTIHIYKWQYKTRYQINIQYEYYNNTYYRTDSKSFHQTIY